LISQELFDQVQAIAATRGVTGQRHRIHDHLLKGLLWCGPCHEQGLERRIVLNKTHGKSGIYWHYFCNGRNFETDTHKHAPYIQTKLVETAVAHAYQRIGFSQSFIKAMQQEIERTVGELNQANQLALEQAQKHLDELTAKEDKLIQLTLDGTIPEDMTRERLASLRNQQTQAQTTLNNLEDNDLIQGGNNIREILHFLENPAAWYNHPLASEASKKQLNAAIFQKIYIYYEQDTGQAQITNITYTNGIQQLKALKQQYRYTGKLSIEQQPLEQSSLLNQQHSLAQITSSGPIRTSTNNQQQSPETPQNSAQTLEELTRTRTRDTAQNADHTTKTREVQDQNPPQSTYNASLNQTTISPQNREITGINTPSEHKNPSTGKTDVTGSSNNNLVPPAGLEPASLAAADFKSTASTDFAKGA
jgi:hypothetical protein